MSARQKGKLTTQREEVRKLSGSGYDRALRLVQAPFGAIFWLIEQVIARREDDRLRREWEERQSR